MKAIAFTFDAVFALVIAGTIIPVFLLLNVDTSSETINERLSLQAEDAIDVISRLRVVDVAKEQVISDIYLAGGIGEADLNLTVMEFVSSLWASNSTINETRAQNITQQVFGKVMPANAKWGFSIDGQTLYDTGGAFVSTVTASRRIVSGFRRGQPSAGYVASAFLNNIGGKNAASYYFFGGFVGEGNVSFSVNDIPFDAELKDVYMELSLGGSFTLYINGNSCGGFNKMQAVDNFTITAPSCLNSVVPGANNSFAFRFNSSNVLTHYVGGGFVRVRYTTSQLAAQQQNTTRVSLPEINGLVNYFDSFYINGNITAVRVYVNMSNDHDVLFNIANRTIFVAPPSAGGRIIEVNNTNISAAVDYSAISSDTVPVRIAPTIVSFLPGGNASVDVILVTDFSGSMKKAINNDTDQGNANINCNNVTAYPNARKGELAKCLDKIFVDIVLNSSGNRLWPVYIFDNKIEYYDNPRNATAIKQNIDSYPQGKEFTCLSCAINLGYDILKNNTIQGENRLKFIVLMTDGLPTHCASGSCVSNLTYYGTQYCQGYCDSQGQGQACVFEGCTDNKCEAPINNTKYSANRSTADQRITIHTIGFGRVDTCSNSNALLQDIADTTGGRYYHSSNTTELENIYRALAQELVNLTYLNQAISITKGSSALHNGSYIEINFTPNAQQPAYQEISLVQETPQFNACNYSLFLPQGVRPIDAKVTSFSGDFWTMNVSVNSTLTGGVPLDVFGLSKYGSRFEELGDPFVVQMPESLFLVNGSNFISVLLGSSATNVSSACSLNSRIIYTSGLRASVPFGQVFPQISGGVVRVYYDEDHDGVQDGYTDISVGASLPNYNPVPRTVEQLDPLQNALDDAVLRLLDSLNLVVQQQSAGLSGEATNPIDIVLANVNIDVTGVGGVPFAWGPLDVTLEMRI